MAHVVPTLEFAFKITMMMGAREKYPAMPNGLRRGFTGAAGGTVEGPALNGRVVENSGGDFPLVDADGNVRFNAHYILEADDGTRIYMHNRGLRFATRELNQRINANEVVPMDQFYFRVAPEFEAPVGPHDWMNRTLFVGSADRREDHGIFHYYAVR